MARNMTPIVLSPKRDFSYRQRTIDEVTAPVAEVASGVAVSPEPTQIIPRMIPPAQGRLSAGGGCRAPGRISALWAL